MNVHTSACALISDCSSSINRPSVNDIKNDVVQLIPPIQKNIDYAAALSESCPEQSFQKFKQCKFCKERLPALIYSTHMETCPNRPYECVSCSETVLLKNKRRHEGYECKSIEDVQSCKFCQERLPTSSYSSHLEKCAERPYKCELCCDTVLFKNRFKHEEHECRLIHSDENDYSNKSSRCERLYDPVVPSSKSLTMDNLEKDSVCCVYCLNKIPFDRFEKHLLDCSKNMKTCVFCKKKIFIDEEGTHLKQCLEKIKRESFKKGTPACVQHISEQNAENNKCSERKKNKKVQNQENSGSFLQKILGRQRTSQEKHSASNIVHEYESQEGGIPCEFCEKIFPFCQIIEHQSGCRPDLLHYAASKDIRKSSSEAVRYDATKHKTDSSIQPGRYQRNDSKRVEYAGKGSSKNTSMIDCNAANADGINEKYMKNRYSNLHSETIQDNFEAKNVISNQPGCRSDLVRLTAKNGKSGFPRHQGEDREELKKEEQNSNKTLYKYSSTRDYKDFQAYTAKEASIDLQRSIGFKTRIGEFPENCELSSQVKHSLSIPFEQISKTEDLECSTNLVPELNSRLEKHDFSYDPKLKAIGAERLQRKGIRRITRDTIMGSSITHDDEEKTTDLYTQKPCCRGKERSGSNHSNDTTESSEDIFLSCGEEDQDSMNERLFVSDNKAKPDFPFEEEEDDRKNEETFGNCHEIKKDSELIFESNSSEDILISRGINDGDPNNEEVLKKNYTSIPCHGNLKSEKKTQFDVVKASHPPPGNLENKKDKDDALSYGENAIAEEDVLRKDNDLEAYFQFLDKEDNVCKTDNAEGDGISQNIFSGAKICKCNNSICYCAISQPSSQTNNSSLSTLEVDYYAAKGARSKNITKCSVSRLPTEKDSKGEMDLQLDYERNAASNIRRKRRILEVLPSIDVSSKEEIENISNWSKWRSQHVIDSDSD